MLEKYWSYARELTTWLIKEDLLFSTELHLQYFTKQICVISSTTNKKCVLIQIAISAEICSNYIIIQTILRSKNAHFTNQESFVDSVQNALDITKFQNMKHGDPIGIN